jgi:NADH-quinone oxidoreductase subunit C
MPDETKSATPPEGEPKPTADKPAIPGGVKAIPSGSVQSETTTTSEKSPSVPVPSPKKEEPAKKEDSALKSGDAAAAGASRPAGHPAPPKPAGPVPAPWDSPMVAKLKSEFGSGITSLMHLGQNYLEVDRSLIPGLLQRLRDDEQFDYCVDITAVHYPKREKQFDVVWILYSYAHNERIRVKTQIGDGEALASSVPIWTTANWLEREVFDMFGIKFEGHPDLKRILLPDGWKGHPLRKDYGIIQQDNEWVQINLGIESGQ